MASLPLPDIQEGISTTTGQPGGPPDHSRTSEWEFRPHPDSWEGLPTTLGHPGGYLDHSRTSGTDFPSGRPSEVGSPFQMSRSNLEALREDQ